MSCSGQWEVHDGHTFNLPPGPIWFLHGFYTVSTALMLIWYLRYEGWSGPVVFRDGNALPESSWPSCSCQAA